MPLNDYTLKREYRSLIDNIAKDFYIPLLNEAVSYKRAVGFFSSSVFTLISKGVMGVVKNGGHVSLIASPYLSEKDVEAIKLGYKTRNEVVRQALMTGMKKPINGFETRQLNMLANLIADGYLDIKIAVTNIGSNIGMYHEKVGIIEDKYGNKVAFSGSMNESANALMSNYEAIDVYCNWTNPNDAERVSDKEASFNAIWENYEPGVDSYYFEDVIEEFVNKYKISSVDYEKYDPTPESVLDAEKDYSFFKVPEYVEFYDYQKEAISNWFEHKGCGIFDMATGAGKTYTALGAVTKLSQSLDENIAVVIVAPYQHLVEQWVEDINNFNVKPIIAYSYPGENWRNQFKDAVNAYNLGVIKNFCIIATNATFSSVDFQNILSKFKRNFCFIVDEAHNFGAKKLSELLPKKARYRLALSATIERHRDTEGTLRIKNFFGNTCIKFTLKDAIQNGFLTSYYYYPIVTYLSDDELEKYNEITEKIRKCGGASPENIEKNPHIEQLLIKRARIVAGCRSKVDKLIEVMEPYKKDNYILVYCGATRYDNESLNDKDQVKQIEEVTYRLFTELGMKARKFTSEESKAERNEIKEMFSSGVDLQVITAIKCLDEGVNIPSIKTAFIMASSTNPKEYIQRRGRVLRRAKGKEFAKIYDFITLPRPLEEVKYCDKKELDGDLSLVNKEFERMLDFAETARNPFDIDMIKLEIEEAYDFNNGLGGLYDEYE